MSENETKGRFRREFESYYADKQVIPSKGDWILVDAIDRIAADVAAVKAKVDSVAPEDVRHFVESEKAWVALVEEQRDAAIRERDEARADVERLRAELAARPPAAAWLTEDERQILANLLLYQWGGLGCLARVAPALRAILDRAGSPPVVEVPALPERTFSPALSAAARVEAQCYRDALDKAGVAWREVPREAFARVFARCPVCCGVRQCKPSCDAERSIMRQAPLLRGRIRDMVEARRALYGEEAPRE